MLRGIAFVSAACGPDEPLRREVAARLAHIAAADAFFEKPLAAVAQRCSPAARSSANESGRIRWTAATGSHGVPIAWRERAGHTAPLLTPGVFGPTSLLHWTDSCDPQQLHRKGTARGGRIHLREPPPAAAVILGAGALTDRRH
jgi:hypothetical protein